MTKYTTLMASLPPLGKLLDTSREPISLLKLENRLKLLDAADTATLASLSNVLAWSEQPLVRTDQEFLRDADVLLKELRQPTLIQLVRERLEMRTVITALRRRHRGEDSPPPTRPWGFGRWVDSVERHWKDPLFGLGAVLPWLGEAQQLLEKEDLVGFERFQFSVVWALLDRLSAGHHFDFEAVVIYLNRWSLVARWWRYNGDAALDRFRRLVNGGMEHFTDVFANPAP
jgi:hypothetical protein